MHDARAIPNHFHTAPWVIYLRHLDYRSRVHTNLHPVHTIIEREVDHAFVHAAVHILYIEFLLHRVFGGSIGIHVLPNALAVKDIEVRTLDARIGHVRHVEIMVQIIANANPAAVGSETNSESGTILCAVP